MYRLRRSACIIIELDVAVGVETALLQQLSLLLHNILECDALVREDLEMVADQMSIPAARTCDQCRAEVIGLLRDAMC
jgi:hypothetical protein